MELGRIPEEVRFTQRRWTSLAAVMFFTSGVGFGVFTIQQGATAVGLAFLAFCGLFTCLGLASLWRPPSAVLDTRGLTLGTAFRTTTYPWRDIDHIGLWEHRQLGIVTSRRVTFNLVEPPSRVAATAGKLGIQHIAIPSVGVKPRELVALMQAFQHRATRAHGADWPYGR